MRLRLMILTLLALSCLSLRAEQFSDSVRVHFRVSRTTIDKELMNNDAAMRGFAERMSQLSDSSDVKVKIERILITGAASPEGSIPLNERLSRQRAAAFTHWLQGYFDFPDTVSQFVFKGRDWNGLLRMVKADRAVPYRDEVLDLLHDIVNTPPSDNYQVDALSRLKALRGGEPYRYLLRKHFPELRASEIFIDATIEPTRFVRPLETSTVGISVPKAIAGAPAFKPYAPADVNGIARQHAYTFAVKTNTLYDIAATPNLGVEFPIGKNFSVGADWMYAWWKNHDRNRHWRIYGGDINARYYFGDARRLQGQHIGVYAQALLFQVAFGGKGYISGIPGQDIFGKPWLGGGVEYGYSLPIARRLNLDFTIGVGYIGGEYRTYRPIDDHYVWQSTHRRNWFGPTKAEISLVWLIGKEGAK